MLLTGKLNIKGSSEGVKRAGRARSDPRARRLKHARWIGSWLSRLADEQLRDSFEAANYTLELGKALSDLYANALAS